MVLPVHTYNDLVLGNLDPFVFVILCSLALTASYTWAKANVSKSPRLQQLPGPPPEPILGHLRSIPLHAAWLTFAEWYKEYGSIAMVRILGRPMVVLNTVEAAHELLEKKGANFSERPQFLVFKEWLGWKYGLPFIPYDDYSRKQRRLVRGFLSSRSMAEHHPILYECAQELLDNLRLTPKAFEEHIHTYVSTVLMKITYGYEPAPNSESLISLARKFGDLASEVEVTTVMTLDLFPFLRHLPEWIPGMGSKRRASIGKEMLRELENRSLDHLLHLRSSGSNRSCIMSQALDDLEKESGDIRTALKDHDTKKRLAHLGVSIFVGGAETSVSTLVTFIFAMLLHPNVAAHAQCEIDQVTGGPGMRLPTFEDRCHVPYVDCIIKEVLRWNPAAPLSIIHQSKDVDEYQGMEIPADSSVMANIWFMCHDESRYSSPDTFNPNRFLRNASTGSITDEPEGEEDPTRISFGFGRRVCPGEHVADAMLWTAVAYILATFDIKPLPDPLGTLLLPDVKFTNGTTRGVPVYDYTTGLNTVWPKI